MPVVPFSDSAFGSTNSSANASAVQQDHAHPLRSHRSAADLLAEQLQSSHIAPQQQPDSVKPATQLLGRARRSGSGSSSHHRRSLARTSIDTSQFQVQTTSPSSLSRGFPTRFRDDPAQSSASTPSSLNDNLLSPTSTTRDYPIIPTRPPLRPTVSFGAISHHSYDSSSPITATKSLQESAMFYEKRASIEAREIKKPALSRKMHRCLSCCFGQTDPPSP
ncbi:unnamed protein product [Cercospora beticola]|nr:unnamed protein product [Cercospora beticola]